MAGAGAKRLGRRNGWPSKAKKKGLLQQGGEFLVFLAGFQAIRDYQVQGFTKHDQAAVEGAAVQGVQGNAVAWIGPALGVLLQGNNVAGV